MSQEPKNMFKKRNNQENLINYKKLDFTAGNKKDYDFTNFSLLRELFKAIYYGEILMPDVEREQDNFDDMIKILKDYKPIKPDNKKMKSLLINSQNFYDGREMIIEAFKNKIFPFYSGNYYHDLREEEPSETDNE